MNPNLNNIQFAGTSDPWLSNVPGEVQAGMPQQQSSNQSSQNQQSGGASSLLKTAISVGTKLLPAAVEAAAL